MSRKKKTLFERFPEFDDRKDFVDFCKYITKLYKDNKGMSQRKLCKYIKTEYDINMYPGKLRKILVEFGADIRGQKYIGVSQSRPSMTIRVNRKVHDYIYAMDDRFDGKHIRRALIDLAFNVITGMPTRNMIIWIDDLKPVHIIWNKVTKNFTMIGDSLSKLEISILEPLLTEVQEKKSVHPIKRYADNKGLLYYGGHSKKQVDNAQWNLPE